MSPYHSILMIMIHACHSYLDNFLFCSKIERTDEWMMENLNQKLINLSFIMTLVQWRKKWWLGNDYSFYGKVAIVLMVIWLNFQWLFSIQVILNTHWNNKTKNKKTKNKQNKDDIIIIHLNLVFFCSIHFSTQVKVNVVVVVVKHTGYFFANFKHFSFLFYGFGFVVTHETHAHTDDNNIQNNTIIIIIHFLSFLASLHW